MRIGFHGRLEDEAEIRAGFIGCGSHSFRNVYPALQFAHVRLVATCDTDFERAKAFAHQFGADRSYSDHRLMLEHEDLDAVFIVVGYDENGRPAYPGLAVDCLKAGVNVWIEKPPAATSTELRKLQAVAEAAGKIVMTGFKKMFAPANRKARELMSLDDFGRVSLVQVQYPQSIPDHKAVAEYISGVSKNRGVIGFLDHLCHPASLLQSLLGRPSSVIYKRSDTGSGVVLFDYDNTPAIASLSLTSGASLNGGMERTMIVGENGRHIVVENNQTVSYHRIGSVGYGDNPDFYKGGTDEATSVWQPEFSLGQLYNKGLFLLGYYGEVEEFALSILENRQPVMGGLDDAIAITQVFEAFQNPPDQKILLSETERRWKTN